MAAERFHENLRREERAEGPSNRSFGLVVGGILCVLSFKPLLEREPPIAWLLLPGAMLVLLGFILPSLLSVPNRLWMKLGLLLGMIVSPIVLGIIFFLVFTPMGLLVRLLGKDLLKIKKDESASSYWIRRDPPGPDPQTMVNQF